MSSYFDIVAKHQKSVIPHRLRFYIEKQLFDGIDFSGKTVLDIGAGIGMFGLYAAHRGARHVDLLEPELDGSSSDMIKTMHNIMEDAHLTNASHLKFTFQDYIASEPYDVVLSHNAINHYDEAACIELLHNQQAKDRYCKDVLTPMADYTKPGGLLIIADAGRHNFYGDIGLRSPFARSIEWQKHQDAKTWAALFRDFGFEVDSIRYTTFNALGAWGAAVMNNRAASYLTHSHFILRLSKQS